ncbi:hypothetical protein SKAU_G00302840 [Synaphobranchus kaupii]|uniref:Uncharacterized protein n=1 Tax=Synaphobranchus kaupii TaxID=118154 RepID=A0A9Q1INH1_SYNKA|nr:hypothetical protein SKAU_G00302840 [Synaphobranchus kaupii]
MPPIAKRSEDPVCFGGGREGQFGPHEERELIAPLLLLPSVLPRFDLKTENKLGTQERRAGCQDVIRGEITLFQRNAAERRRAGALKERYVRSQSRRL